MKTGIELIKEERVEQVIRHGRDAAHDDRHTNEELIDAAIYVLTGNPRYYPGDWDKDYRAAIFKKNRIHQLKVAGALIAAEIDRLIRIEEKKNNMLLAQPGKSANI